jgi:hypothetical protein
MTKEEKAKDKRLQKLYGIDLADYNIILSRQNGLCAICGRPPLKLSLSVDHDHKAKHLKIVYEKSGFYTYYAKADWLPECAERYRHATGIGETKKEAAKDLRRQLQRLSIRGLLHFNCNAGLRKYCDSPERLEAAARYLRKHQEGL